MRVASQRVPRDDTRSLARLIDDHMRAGGLTLEAMAARTDLSLATVAALRIGTRGKRPRATTLRKLAAAMGVEASVLERAVARGGAPVDAREAALVEDFRALDEQGKHQLEALAERLRRG